MCNCETPLRLHFYQSTQRESTESKENSLSDFYCGEQEPTAVYSGVNAYGDPCRNTFGKKKALFKIHFFLI